jgi:hypothetical protein
MSKSFKQLVINHLRAHIKRAVARVTPPRATV